MTVMMGYIAHDLRAPLSTVLQYSKDEKAVMQGGIKSSPQPSRTAFAMFSH